jgi:hypothetical protein
MFYYLLDKSTFLQKHEGKNKQTSILIYGTIIYIIFHFILSNLNNKNVLKYFWVIFSIDVISICINTNITSNLIFNKPTIEEPIKSNLKKKTKSNIKKTVRFFEPEPEPELELEPEPEPEQENNKKINKEKKKKHNKKRKSTPISELIQNKEDNNLGNEIDTDKEEEINITLADLQPEVSDGGGSDIDLDSFEKNYFE